MSDSLSNIPNGVRYYFGTEARLRRKIEDAVMSVFDKWAYEEIITPTVDYYALFERGMGRHEASRAFRFGDADGRLLALRPDVTSSVARAAATIFAERPRPLRFCYAATVFHARPRSHVEWRRESTQLGCELIGIKKQTADIEMLAIVAEIIARLGLRDECRITLNNVAAFDAILRFVGNGAAQTEKLQALNEHLRAIVDMRDSAAIARFFKTHAPQDADATALARLTQLTGGREALDEAKRIADGKNKIGALDLCDALAALEKLWRAIEARDLADMFEIDLGDVSGMDYYTSFVFKIYLNGAGASVGSGGRYDNLAKNFERDEPAVGFVLDLDALTEVLANKDRKDRKDGIKER